MFTFIWFVNRENGNFYDFLKSKEKLLKKNKSTEKCDSKINYMNIVGINQIFVNFENNKD